MKLKTLKEHEDEVWHLHKCKKLTGIECPNCKNELQFTSPGMYMCSSPLQADIKCFNCNYETRIHVVRP